MATRKTSSDWDRIELEYLSGEVSIREIADRHEISDTAIRKRAKAEGWVRAVRRAQPARTCELSPREPRAPHEPAPDASVIAERGRGLVARMMDELDATTTHLGELEEMIEEISRPMSTSPMPTQPTEVRISASIIQPAERTSASMSTRPLRTAATPLRMPGRSLRV